MASRTAQVERIRARKRMTNGRKRKNKLRLYGTTAPLLPLNVPNAHEQAQIKARAASRK